MSLTIEIAFECLGEKEAASLEAVLAPDNHPLPRGQKLVSRREGKTLLVSIASLRPSNCVSSALSLLADARLYAQVWALAS